MENSESRPLEMLFLPFLTPSHMVPLFEIACLFAARGQHVTFVTTPGNTSNLRPTTDLDAASGHPISLHVIPLPSKEVGLPDGLESFTSTTNNSTYRDKLFRAFFLLRPKIEELILRRRPDCIVADMFYPWTAYLGIPRLHFNVSSLFHLCLEYANRSPNSPHWTIKSETEPFVIPGLPDPITMTRSQLPDYIIDPAKDSLMDEIKEAKLKSYGLIVNSFYELESAYTEHYKKITGNKVFNVGPVTLIHRSSREKSERVFKPVVDEQECLSWLNSKKQDSVLYISFGSLIRLPDVQLMEIACGLEASGHQFIWVVHGKDKDGVLAEEDDKCWLPKGFYDRIKDRGLILKGWAPQVLILDHPSVGGFLTHCGWSSFTEGVYAGVPLITWPVHFDQFYNEKLATQVLGIGVEVGSEDWTALPSNELQLKKVIKREKIAKAVEMLMDGGNEAVVKMRQKVKELREMTKKAVEEGGSSHGNLTIVIEELKQLRDKSITS